MIQAVNKHFVPIRVDNDRRPDINRRYNLGGWPTTVFLTPQGSVITGGTYIPPDQMKEVLKVVRETYLQGKIPSPITVTERVESAGTGEVSSGIVDDVLGYLVASFDSECGGFGDSPKFPHTNSLELLLSQYWGTRDKGLLTIVTKTLDRMAEGGIYDHEEGGFFRYSTTRDWSVPHYEKMCEDNAKLLSTTLHAFQATGRDAYRRVADEIVRYVRFTLSDQNAGGFYGSQDADEDLLQAPQRKSEQVPIDRTWTRPFTLIGMD